MHEEDQDYEIEDLKNEVDYGEEEGDEDCNEGSKNKDGGDKGDGDEDDEVD